MAHSTAERAPLTPTTRTPRTRRGLTRALEGPMPGDDPAPDQLADDHDQLDWNIERDGRMRDHADEPEPPTIPWEG